MKFSEKHPVATVLPGRYRFRVGRPAPALARIALLVLWLGAFTLAAAQEDADESGSDPAAEPTSETRAADTVSGSIDDSTGSIESVRDVDFPFALGKWQFKADARVGYIRQERDERDATTSTTTNWQGRFRLSSSNRITDWAIFNARLAVTCTTDACDPDLTLDPSETTTSSIDEGDLTFDEFYIHIFRLEKFDAAFGRLQTKFTTRAGVFAKSLDRNNSNNFNINWTDGLHGTYHVSEESIFHFIAEYNDADGVSNVRRAPLDFTDSGARTSYFVSWEDLGQWGPVIQRGFNITYLPSALLKDGLQTGPTEDYFGIVARMVAAREFGTKGRRLNVGGEIGYAPETPLQSAVGLPGSGDTGGFAWAVYASIMDIWPNHSIGINISATDPGWLLSPQYRPNEDLLEIRHLWRKRRDLALEIRVRFREDRDRYEGQEKRDETDYFARFTIGFGR